MQKKKREIDVCLVQALKVNVAKVEKLIHLTVF